MLGAARPEAPAPRPEPQEEPAAPLYGTLQVGTRVWVDVHIDGRKVGRAPDRSHYPLTPGTHRLRAVKPDSDCVPFEREFTITAGETTRLRLDIVCD